VLVLSPELQIRGQTLETSEYLKILIPPVRDRDPIPAIAYNVAAQLLAVEADIDGNAPSTRVHVADGLWMTARAARLDGPGPARENDIAVSLEESSGADSRQSGLHSAIGSGRARPAIRLMAGCRLRVARERV
jgi:hypothetical protein